MFLTQEDYRKIESWLKLNSRKDTDFDFADSIDGSETIAIVQDNKNKRISIDNLLGNFIDKDFINVTNTLLLHGINLETAIHSISPANRKEGLIITFEGTDSNWYIYQFVGNLSQWYFTDLWKDIFNWETYVVESILPDNEDLTTTEPDEQGNTRIKFADKEYNPDNFSGLGHVILRKNLVEVMDSETGKSRGITNFLYQNMIKKENTIYEIKYDFDLNGQTITIPNNCVLYFKGGKLDNGTVRCNSTTLDGYVQLGNKLGLSGSIKNQELSFQWFGAKADGITDDIIPIQRAIDVCAGLSGVNTVTGLSGKYLITKPVNLVSNKSVSRHSICIRGTEKPNPNTGKGLIIIGLTGDGNPIIECIDSATNLFENIALFSNGEGASTIGVTLARGEQLGYVPNAVFRDCYIGICVYDEKAPTYNGGFGTVGLLISDAEESHFFNVEVSANCCVMICNSKNSFKKPVFNTDGSPQDLLQKFNYKEYYSDVNLIHSRYVSNTVYTFLDCRFLTLDALSPSLIIAGAMSIYIKNTFIQNSYRHMDLLGNCNTAMYITEGRNILMDAVMEGYYSCMLLDGTLMNSKMNIVTDGANHRNGVLCGLNLGLILFKNLIGGERECFSNTISISSNYDKNLFLFYREDESTYKVPMYKIYNNIIRSNVNTNEFNSCLDMFLFGNIVEFKDGAYTDFGRSGYNYNGKIKTLGKIGMFGEEQWWEIYQFKLNNQSYLHPTTGSDAFVEGTIILHNGGQVNSATDGHYTLKFAINILDNAKSGHNIKASSDITYRNIFSRYEEYKIAGVETKLVINNNSGTISLLCKPLRRALSSSTVDFYIHCSGNCKVTSGLLRGGMIIDTICSKYVEKDGDILIEEGNMSLGDKTSQFTTDTTIKDNRFYDTSKEAIIIWNGKEFRNEDGTLTSKVRII